MARKPFIAPWQYKKALLSGPSVVPLWQPPKYRREALWLVLRKEFPMADDRTIDVIYEFKVPQRARKRRKPPHRG